MGFLPGSVCAEQDGILSEAAGLHFGFYSLHVVGDPRFFN